MGGGPDKEHLLILHWDPRPEELLAELKRRFPYFDITYFQVVLTKNSFREPPTIPEELWKSATILITLGALPPRPELVPNLKLMHLLSAGVDHYVNHSILKDSDIPITTSSGIHGPPITEWIIMTTLVKSRHYAASYEAQKQHHWGLDRSITNTFSDWVGKTVGIAGYGSIGRQAARVFSALGARVHAYTASPRSTPSSRADNGYIVAGTGDPDGSIPSAWYSGTSKESLHTFLASGLDALIISLPLTPSTRHLFSTPEFEILSRSNPPPDNPTKKGRSCFLINIGRGGLIDQPALVDALNNDVLAGAALDVADPEPLPADDPLWDAKNIILTPHVSGLGVEYKERAFDLFMTNWERRERGEQMFNLFDRKKGY